MKLIIMAVRDIKANAYMTPFFHHNTGAAIREFGDLCSGAKEHPFAQHPEDYELYELGWWGDGDAHFEIYNAGPRQIAVGSNFKK